ncbi:MAG: tRNA (adenosine(37)-N6)-dimethylallyltransferase MiaA [Lachnospiraceae bacterium]|nr:tRNA (adenosine(37)-N6)-dimethylallyltransferase MiaA [Lachnospiraceae bacterium]
MNKLIVLTGPTAVGKTGLSIGLAKKINGEIISADSMQVYKGMDIGTAKIKKEEMQGVKHYLIDVLDPKEDFNVFTFQKMAKDALKEIYEKGKIPIIVGGTGFYIQALLYDIDFTTEGDDEKIREELTEYLNKNGVDALYKLLYDIDPESCNVIHKNNTKKVIRAIAFYRSTGTKISEHNEVQKEKESPYDFRYFVLNDERDKLYNRINDRIDEMIEEGLVGEVEGLLKNGLNETNISMQGLGYKEIVKYLKGECSLEDAVYELKLNTRHFAKRQLTWFKREKDVIWVNKNEYKSEDEIMSYLLSFI